MPGDAATVNKSQSTDDDNAATQGSDNESGSDHKETPTESKLSLNKGDEDDRCVGDEDPSHHNGFPEVSRTD